MSLSFISVILAAAGTFLCGVQATRSKGRTRFWWLLGAAVFIGLNTAIQILLFRSQP